MAARLSSPSYSPPKFVNREDELRGLDLILEKWGSARGSNLPQFIEGRASQTLCVLRAFDEDRIPETMAAYTETPSY